MIICTLRYIHSPTTSRCCASHHPPASTTHRPGTCTCNQPWSLWYEQAPDGAGAGDGVTMATQCSGGILVASERRLEPGDVGSGGRSHTEPRRVWLAGTSAKTIVLMVCSHSMIPISYNNSSTDSDNRQKGYTGTDTDGMSQWKWAKFNLVGTNIGTNWGQYPSASESVWIQCTPEHHIIFQSQWPFWTTTLWL